jgi:hypothetical protein
VTVSVSAADATSGVDKVFYRIGDSGEFSPYDPAHKPTVNAEGLTEVWAYATDVAGNGAPSDAVMSTIRIDTHPPTTVASLSPTAGASGWHAGPVTVRIAANDAGGESASGPAQTRWRLDGGAWQAAARSAASTSAGAPVASESVAVVSGDGVHTLEFCSVDAAGNAESAAATTLRIDGRRPSPVALANVCVKRGRTAKLRYRVDDVVGSSCSVTIRLVSSRGKVVRTLRARDVASNASSSASFRCSLKRGVYRWKVYATDCAGNVQAKPAERRLTVK